MSPPRTVRPSPPVLDLDHYPFCPAISLGKDMFPARHFNALLRRGNYVLSTYVEYLLYLEVDPDVYAAKH